MELNISDFKVLIDDKDYNKINMLKWVIKVKSGYPIAVSPYYDKNSKNTRYINMARYLMDVTDKKIDIDHKNGNTLDNKRSTNLREGTHQENMFNQKIKSNNTTGYKGVSFDSKRNKFRAYIVHNYKQIFLGYHRSKKKAALKYNNKAIELFGEFALLNKI